MVTVCHSRRTGCVRGTGERGSTIALNGSVANDNKKWRHPDFRCVLIEAWSLIRSSLHCCQQVASVILRKARCNMKITGFCDVTPFSLVNHNQSSEGACCFYLSGTILPWIKGQDDMTSCSLVEQNRSSCGTCCLHFKVLFCPEDVGSTMWRLPELNQ
jgi:hypothetical protein